MQTQQEERRASHVRRVELETLVEICGRDPNVPPFEAESIEVSGRGMQVRTRYLPDLHTPLVLRFEHDSHEVLVEGEVAWRRGDEQGGEFGIKFTALDSKSVSALKALCSRVPAEREAEAAEDGYLSERGAPVKLHIQGLGAPMKARVFRGTERKIEVGSQLEFLKVGRVLELEDVSDGSRRAAHIDTVNVAIDAQNQIPQLVVSLRYEGVSGDETPEPAVLSAKKRAASASDEPDSDDAGADEGDYDDEEEEFTEDIFKGKLGTMLSHAGGAMKSGSVEVARWTSRAALGVSGLVRATTERIGKSKTAPRKSTRPVAGVASGVRQPVRRGDNAPLRRQNPRLRGAAEAPARKKPWAAIGVAAAVAVAGGAWWSQGSSNATDPVASNERERTSESELEGTARAVAGDARPGQAEPVALPPVGAGSAAGGTAAARFPKAATLSEVDQRAAQGGIVAQVPLFGATPMATSEPAPMNPVPQTNAIDELSLAQDQVFADDSVPPPAAEAALARARAGAARTPALQAATPAEPPAVAGSEAFQVGRMHLPIVYRLRLDGAAQVLQGEKLPTGFSVLVPGRKVMESGSSIEGRDDRIISVRVQNTPAGGKVTFRFRKDIPGYKARVRKDYVEFFVNSPERK